MSSPFAIHHHRRWWFDSGVDPRNWWLLGGAVWRRYPRATAARIIARFVPIWGLGSIANGRLRDRFAPNTSSVQPIPPATDRQTQVLNARPSLVTTLPPHSATDLSDSPKAAPSLRCQSNERRARPVELISHCRYACDASRFKLLWTPPAETTTTFSPPRRCGFPSAWPVGGRRMKDDWIIQLQTECSQASPTPDDAVQFQAVESQFAAASGLVRRMSAEKSDLRRLSLQSAARAQIAVLAQQESEERTRIVGEAEDSAQAVLHRLGAKARAEISQLHTALAATKSALVQLEAELEAAQLQLDCFRSEVKVVQAAPVPDTYEEQLRSVAAEARAVSLTQPAMSAAWHLPVRFVAQKKLGNGATCDVYQGIDRDRNVPVALKVFRSPDRGEAERQLRAEVDIVWRLEGHPNVVRYEDCFPRPDDAPPFIVMELMGGGSLDALVRRRGGLPEPLVREYALQVVRAVVHLHSKGVIHGDLKPANILLNADFSVVKVSDFGNSSLTMPSDSATAGTAWFMGGTAAYLPPEWFRSPWPLAHNDKVDVWGLACCITFMLGGRDPWAELPVNVRNRDRFGSYIASLSAPAHVPWFPDTVTPALRSLLQRCFKFDRSQRPTAAEMMDDPWFELPA